MTEEIRIQRYDSPFGEIVLGSLGKALCLCDWGGKPCAEKNERRLLRLLNAGFREGPSPVIERAKTQLDEYFTLRRRTFDLLLHEVGTPFQRRVWDALLEIPYGQTRTYKEIAQRVGDVRAVRAVAQAIGANGIGIIIPCHRVIGSNGTLTGFAGGLEVKKELLLLETSSEAALAGK